jgi:CBS domain-containing protein
MQANQKGRQRVSVNADRFFSKLEPFSLLSDDIRKEIAEKASVIRYEKGQVISEQGKTTLEKIYVLQEGSVEIAYHTEDGNEITTRLGPGEILGGVSILMNAGLAVRTARTRTRSSFYVLSRKDFMALCSRNQSFQEFFVESFGQRRVKESYSAEIATAQALHFLADIAPFSFLPEEELRRIAPRLSTVYYPADTVIFVQNESRIDHVFVLQKGAAERYFEEENEKLLRAVLGEGSVFGGISMLLNDMIAVRTFRTTEESYFYTLPAKDFFELCQRYEAFSEFFTDAFGKRMLDRTYAEIVARNLTPRTDALQFLNQPVSSLFTRELVDCSEETSIREAAGIMSRQGCSSIFVRNAGGKYTGVVTDNDLRAKVIAQAFDINQPVAAVMTKPLIKVPRQALLFEALMTMMQNNIKHLAVSDSRGKVIGVISNQDLISAQGQSPFFLVRELSAAPDLETLVVRQRQLPKLVRHLIQAGAKAKNINRFVTTVSDVVLDRLIGFALRELGEPPVRFVFMILGSEGRREQTLKTDQDNAIVFEDVPESQLAEVRQYFLQFGRKVCTWLDQAGYDFCEGGIMAQNEQWCQPLSVWKEYFSSWIHAAEAEDLLQSSIFFDFRGAYGEHGFIDELRNDLFESLAGWSGFFRHLTENALHFKPPLGFFRNFVVESKGKHRDMFDIKHAMMPVVDFARIYALHNQIAETNTLERLLQLQRREVLSEKEYNEIEHAYSFLMQLRFVRQVTAVLENGGAPDNYINPKKLTDAEQKMLKEIFKRIENFQTKLSFDFTGMP